MACRAAVYKRCGCRVREPDGVSGGRCPRLVERGHGSWYFSLELPCGPDGRRHRVRRGGFRTRAAAEQARAYLLGADVIPGCSAVTVGQWLDIWLEMRQSLSFNTRRLYAQHVSSYLKPYLGNVPLRSLTVARVQAMFVALARANSMRARPLAPATFVRIRGALHAALNGAIRMGLIERNPAHLVELPPGRRPRAVVWTDARVAHWQATGERPPVAVWTAHQTAMFLSYARSHPLYEMYLAVALLGLRRGEAAGLRWCDLDLDIGTVQVSHQVQDRGGRTVVCPPKTEASVRTLALDHVLASALRRLRGRTGSGQPTGFVFSRPDGSPFSPGYLTHTFNRLVVDAGLPPIRLHDLRHGAASLSLAAGNDLKVVQALLGHSSIVLTADTYTSVLPCLAHRAAEATAALVLAAARHDAEALRHNRKQRRHRGKRRSRKDRALNGGRIRSHAGPITRSKPTGKILV
ncbi:tyrosine-type recombinase/integrase [Amycolatopsis sp. NPDC001319]